MRDGAPDYVWHRGYLSPAELAHLRGRVAAHEAAFQRVRAKAGMNLPYRVIDGERLSRELPDLHALASGPLRELAEAAAGRPLEPMRDPRRAVRLQCYRALDEGFRWHLDGGRWGAILTLANSNEGATEVLSGTASRWLAPVPYVLFPFPQLLELARPVALRASPGDLLILDGGRLIHRGVTRRPDGERIVLAASFDPVGTRRPRAWDWLARRLNY